MEFYCQSCETAMCRECTEGEHAEHPTVPLKDVVEQHKASLQVQLDAVNKRYGGSSNYFLFSVLPLASHVSLGRCFNVLVLWTFTWKTEILRLA